jgi:hypothetical protein
MRTVGTRKERAITFNASAELLTEGARFNDELQRLPTGGQTFIPKGLYRFRTHEEANAIDLARLAGGLAEIAWEQQRWTNSVAPPPSKT